MKAYLNKWHRQLCRITGSILMSLTKKVVKKDELEDWANTLENIATEMRRGVKYPTKR